MHEEGDYLRRPENKYEQTLSRHFEAWQYQESLAKVCSIFYFYFSISLLARFALLYWNIVF